MQFFRKLFQLRQRCDPEPPRELVDPLANLSPEHILANLSPEHIDGLIAELARRTITGVPHPTHMNIRFRSHEWALLNIKQLGYDLGRRLASANLSRVVEAPPDTVLKTSVCKQADIESDWCLFWCQEMKTAPFYHRKIWEFCYICQVLWHAGKLSPGNAGLGFGCGIEPLPSLFAKYGATIVATDVELSDPASQNWAPTGQHASGLEAVRRPEICPDPRLLDNIGYRPVDMNDIPRDLDGSFDFCWSACALEHLGSLAKGLDFIENSLRTLKSGGVAVHTTEFNFDESETIDNWPSVLYQRCHFEEFAERLAARGYLVAPLDFDAGSGILDGLIDIPPYDLRFSGIRISDPALHLKLCVDGFPVTSVGIAITAP